MRFTVERTAAPGWRVLGVHGELDLATVDQLLDAVDAELGRLCAVPAGRGAGPPRMVLDLAPTRFLDSTGAWALVRAARATHASGVVLSITCPPANTWVRRVLDLLRLHALVPITDALPAAAPTPTATATATPSIPTPRAGR